MRLTAILALIGLTHARRNTPEPRRTPWFAAATAIAAIAVLFCGSAPEPADDSDIGEVEPLALQLWIAGTGCPAACRPSRSPWAKDNRST